MKTNSKATLATDGVTPTIHADEPESALSALGVPVANVIEIKPQPDPVYGHTFKLPAFPNPVGGKKRGK